MTDTFRAACIQTNSTDDMDANIKVASDLARQARDAGADLITLPEAVNIMEADRKALKAKVFNEQEDPALEAFRNIARETGAWVLLGSLLIDDPEGEKMLNRSYLLDGQGDIRASYDKIHMFDVNLGGAETHRESNAYRAGSTAVLTEMPWCSLGMTICYDVRFANLYRTLAHAGARMLSVPAAFTRVSGEAHWHVLLRARAIETGSFVIAPAQCGDHPGSRQTYGHSLIVDPWGSILADGGEDTGFVISDIDMAHVEEARQKIPALTHDRDFSLNVS